MLPVISIAGIEVPSYTLMVICGVIAGYAVIARRGAIYSIPSDEVASTYILASVGAFLGGKAMFMLQGLPVFIGRLLRGDITIIQYAEQAGLVFYGGMLGCLLFVWLASRAFGTSFWAASDTVLPALPLAQSFGRVGCFMVGCCYGVPSDFGFDMSASNIAPPGVTLFPVQLAESVCTLVLFFVLYHMGRVRRAPGQMLGTYLLWYGAARFALEFFRYDSVRGFIGIFSVSQWISIGAAVCGVILLHLGTKAMPASVQRDLLKY